MSDNVAKQPISCAESKLRISLYRKGLSDEEIAQHTGTTTEDIKRWRHNRQLPANKNPTKKVGSGGVPMEQALSPEECRVMRAFLRTLVCAAKKCPPGTELHIGRFMERWREVVYGIRMRGRWRSGREVI